MKHLLLGFFLLGAAGTASADLQLEFREGAPKDRIILTNTGGCTLSDASVTLDMSQSTGRLIFDTTGSGAGVQVFQPFEVVSGREFLGPLPRVSDGQNTMSLELTGFTAGARIEITTDLDDTIGAREITVRNSEFAGSVVRVKMADGQEFSGAAVEAAAQVRLGCAVSG